MTRYRRHRRTHPVTTALAVTVVNTIRPPIPGGHNVHDRGAARPAVPAPFGGSRVRRCAAAAGDRGRPGSTDLSGRRRCERSQFRSVLTAMLGRRMTGLRSPARTRFQPRPGIADLTDEPVAEKRQQMFPEQAGLRHSGDGGRDGGLAGIERDRVRPPSASQPFTSSWMLRCRTATPMAAATTTTITAASTRRHRERVLGAASDRAGRGPDRPVPRSVILIRARMRPSGGQLGVAARRRL